MPQTLFLESLECKRVVPDATGSYEVPNFTGRVFTGTDYLDVYLPDGARVRSFLVKLFNTWPTTAELKIEIREDGETLTPLSLVIGSLPVEVMVPHSHRSATNFRVTLKSSHPDQPSDTFGLALLQAYGWSSSSASTGGASGASRIRY